MDSYIAGRQAREATTALPGVAFTLLFIAPFLFIVYPVLGLTLWAAFLTGYGAFFSSPYTTRVFVGLILAVAGSVPAMKFEHKASQLALYRLLRKWIRLFASFAGAFVLRAGGLGFNGKLDLSKAPPDTLFLAIAFMILVHFVFRTLDRLYFPVHAGVQKAREMAAAGIPLQRRSRTRLWYSLLWIVPFVAILNLIIRGVVSGMTDGAQERIAFYDQYSPFVYGFDFIAWLMCCLSGILPGTGKRVTSFVDQTIG
jgi:hypothetical protein